MERRIGDHRSIVFLVICCRLIGNGRIDLLFGVIAAQDGADSRPGQGIMDELRRRECSAERRTLLLEQPASEESLHNRDPDVLLFTHSVK